MKYPPKFDFAGTLNMMKSTFKRTFKICQIVLLMYGVFGADEDEVKSVSVMEGDSVTLNPDPDKIQGFILILWRFGGPVITQIDGNEISYPSHTEIFRDRLQLDQTGSLTIRNMRTKHSGLYKLQVDHSTGISYKKPFSVTVYESPSVIDGAEAELKSVSVKEGDPVSLHVPQIQGDELIVWRFGDEGKLIAKADIEAKSSSLYDETDERFRDRLKLDQTGSLTITNTRSTDSGEYKVKISSNKQTLYKRFIVTVSVPGVTSAAVAWIVVIMLVVAVAIVVGVEFYYRCRPSKLPKEKYKVEEIFLTGGDSVTLEPDTEIQRDDQILWMFGDQDKLIAQIRGGTVDIYDDDVNERFKDKLKLDKKYGSLTITKFEAEHTGPYKVMIISRGGTLYKRFFIKCK